MTRPRHRVADVFRAGWDAYRENHPITSQVKKVVRHMMSCRTAALGGHLYRCDQCDSEVPLYNSCRDRNCPSCQTSAKEDWLDQRFEELLPVRYFHVVFTLPHDLNDLIAANRRTLINELFQTVNWVLTSFGKDPQWKLQGQIGVLAILHTWNQKLLPHYHIHCLVPGGAWNADKNQWRNSHLRFLFGHGALKKAFRKRYIKRLESLRRRGKLVFDHAAAPLAGHDEWDRLMLKLSTVKWMVYPKATTAKPEQVLDYLGRYTHKVAIGDHRILDVSNGQVTFTWRDRSDGNTEKTMTIPIDRFIARYIHHILPSGFRKIRYIGFLSARQRGTALPAIRQSLHTDKPENPNADETLPERILRRTGTDITLCPQCKKGHLCRTDTLSPVPPDKPP